MKNSLGLKILDLSTSFLVLCIAMFIIYVFALIYTEVPQGPDLNLYALKDKVDKLQSSVNELVSRTQMDRFGNIICSSVQSKPEAKE